MLQWSKVISLTQVRFVLRRSSRYPGFGLPLARTCQGYVRMNGLSLVSRKPIQTQTRRDSAGGPSKCLHKRVFVIVRMLENKTATLF